MKRLLSILSTAALLLILATPSLSAQTGPAKLSNVVCFVKFADQADNEWEHDFDYYENLFNAIGPDVNSVRNYFSEMSYGNFDWESQLILTEYVDSHPRNYFCEWSASNPDGYQFLDLLLDTRTRTLVKDMCDYFSTVIPDDVVLDADGDGTVDNIVIIFNGNSERGSSHMLWPANNTAPSARLKGLNVKHYLKVFDGANGYKSLVAQKLNTGVLCHEMMHTLNAYDLYTSSSSPAKEPVGKWDLMSDNQNTPQGLTAYMRMTYGAQYGNWLPAEDIPVISEAGEYELLPISSAEGTVAYKIIPDSSRKEYFMLEYRDRNQIWDYSLPSAGIIVYRVNPAVNGNLGKECELYIFRPGGATDKAGNLNRAALGPNTGRLSFGTEEDADSPYYSDGTRAPFSISDVKLSDNGISFKYRPVTGDDSAVDEINAVTGSPRSIFTLQGIRLDHIPGPGMYIVDGRKIFVK